MGINMPLPKKKQAVDKTVEFPPAQQIDMTIEEGIACVKETTLKRNQNNRDSLTQAMKAGRALIAIKAQVPYGQWTQWLKDNAPEMGYGLVSNHKPERAAQYDMALWRGMEIHQQRLVELKLIDPLDSNDSEIIETFDDETITVAIGAFYELTRRNAPDEAVEIALNKIASGEYKAGDFGRPEAKKLVKMVKAIKELPEKHRKVAEQLQQKGLDNPEVISYIPELVDEHPELVEEMVSSGMMTVPHKTEQMPIESISATDVELTMGYEDTEKAFGYIERNKELVAEIKDSRKRRFKQGGIIEGTPAQVQKQLDDSLKKKNGKYIRVVWYEQEETE